MTLPKTTTFSGPQVPEWYHEGTHADGLWAYLGQTLCDSLNPCMSMLGETP